MKKYLLVLLIGFVICIQNVNAATVTSSKYENGLITITGTGTKQAQIVIFDKNNSPIYMTTAPITDGKYNIILPKIATLVKGNYVIKVADYDGKNVSETKLEIKSTNTASDSPNTHDNLVTYIILFGLGCVGIGTIYIYNKKKAMK